MTEPSLSGSSVSFTSCRSVVGNRELERPGEIQVTAYSWLQRVHVIGDAAFHQEARRACFSLHDGRWLCFDSF